MDLRCGQEILKAWLGKTWPVWASVAMLSLAFPPFNVGLLSFAALTPWLVNLRNLPLKGAFRSGYLFGVLFMLGQLYFMFALTYGWTGSLWLGLTPWVLSSLFAGLYFALFALIANLCWRLRSPWMIPIAWAGVEVLRSYIPGLHFPWALAGVTLWMYPPLIQMAHYGAVFLASAWVVLANVLLAQWLEKEPWSHVRLGLTVFAILLGLSIVRYTTPAEGAPIAVTVGQPGVDLAFDGSAEGKLARVVPDLMEAAGRQEARLLVLPEGISTRNVGFPPELPFPLDFEVPVIFGGQRGQEPRYQTAFAYDGTWSYADKTRLVIIGEYVPARDWIPFLRSFNLPGGDLTPGDQVKTLPVAGMKVGPMLCFEGLFTDIGITQARNGAQLLAIMSIDDWFKNSAAPEQLRAATVFRAIEAGVPVVRAASLGYTLAVDARGNVLGQAPWGAMYPLKANLTVPKQADLFPFVTWFGWLCLASLAVVPAVYWRFRGSLNASGGPSVD